MSKPRTYQTEAIIIRKTKLGEADRILTLFTPHLGKIEGVAKGVRRPRSKLAGHLELLTYSTVSLAHGRNLDTIIGSQTINSFLPLKDDLDRSAHALYLVELVNQFSAEHMENFPLFQLLLETLGYLCQDVSKELALRYFEMRLLDAVGYRPQLQQCVACHNPLEPVTNSFCAVLGGMLCPQCSPHKAFSYSLPINTFKVLRFLQNSDFNAASKLKLDDEISRQVEMVIRDYLKYLLERDVKSTAWLDELKRGTNG